MEQLGARHRHALQGAGVGVDADQARGPAADPHQGCEEVARAAGRVAHDGRGRIAAPALERDLARQVGLGGRRVDGAEGATLVAAEMIGGRRHPAVL